MAVQTLQENVNGLKEKVPGIALKGNLLRDMVIFFAGVSAFHMLTHFWLAMSDMLPMSVPLFPSLTITQGMNVFIIVVNAFVTAGLLYWAHRLKK